MRLGISITTRNRPDILRYTLKHFAKYEPAHKAQIVITDDCSDPESNQLNIHAIKASNLRCVYIHSERRLGIAKNKNVGIKELLKVGCEWVFLFDDDCMPIKEYWDLPFILLANAGCEHSMHLVEAGPEVKIAEELNDRIVWTNAGGYCLFATRRCLLETEGFNPAFGIYGFEHADFTRRAAKLGFCGAHQYVSPKNSGDYIYSLDMDLGWKKKPSPLMPLSVKFHSSVENERDKLEAWIEENRKIYMLT